MFKTLLFFIFIIFFKVELGCSKNTSSSLPRFAALRHSIINMHVGPGKKYPVNWQYIKQGLPVEIIAEFDIWRKIKDEQGQEGWVQKNQLMGKRNCIIQHKTQSLRLKPKEDSTIVAYAEPGVVARLLLCQSNWCRIEVKDKDGKPYTGWLLRKDIWGVYPHEVKF